LNTLNSIPLVDLLTIKISTGNMNTDESIQSAKKQFFTNPRSKENMRSACESLIFILEPLKKELSNAFTSEDINTFFQIVNAFDIRHNKVKTKKLEYDAQYEWIFYTLINTIYTYSKIKLEVK